MEHSLFVFSPGGADPSERFTRFGGSVRPGILLVTPTSSGPLVSKFEARVDQSGHVIFDVPRVTLNGGIRFPVEMIDGVTHAVYPIGCGQFVRSQDRCPARGDIGFLYLGQEPALPWACPGDKMAFHRFVERHRTNPGAILASPLVQGDPKQVSRARTGRDLIEAVALWEGSSEESAVGAVIPMMIPVFIRHPRVAAARDRIMQMMWFWSQLPSTHPLMPLTATRFEYPSEGSPGQILAVERICSTGQVMEIHLAKIEAGRRVAAWLQEFPAMARPLVREGQTISHLTRLVRAIPHLPGIGRGDFEAAYGSKSKDDLEFALDNVQDNFPVIDGKTAIPSYLVSHVPPDVRVSDYYSLNRRVAVAIKRGTLLSHPVDRVVSLDLSSRR